MTRFIDLPQDILFSIYACIGPRDLLALNQTCHSLHALGTRDYIWRRLNTDLPLDIDRNTNPGTPPSFSEIRRSVIDALRIDANWTSKSTRIRRLRRVDHGDIVHGVQLLKGDWLISLSRNPTAGTSYLSAWYLRGNAARRAAKLEVPHHPDRLHATARNNGDSALIALCTNTVSSGWFQVCSLSLNHDHLCGDPVASPIKRVAEVSFAHHHSTTRHEAFTDIQVCDNIIAASLARIDEAGPTLTYQIVIIDIDTSAALLLDVERKEDKAGSYFKFKLFPEHVVFFVCQTNGGSMFVQGIRHLMPPFPSSKRCFGSQMFTIFDVDEMPTLGCGSLRPLYTSKHFASDCDVIFTQETLSPTQRTLEVVSLKLEKAWFFRLPILLAELGNSPNLNASHSTLPAPTTCYTLRAGSHPILPYLGRTGLRMVWIEHVWEIDAYKLMKATFPRTSKQDRFTVSELLPAHVALPFQPHTCVSIWFEEASGRLCFGLHTGEVFILDI